MGTAVFFETTGKTAGGDSVAVRLTSGPGYNHPTAPGYFEGRIRSASDAGPGLAVQRSVFAGGNFGGGDLDYGLLEAINLDAALDGLIDLGYGAPASLKIGDDDGAYSLLTPIMTARASGITVANDALSFIWESRMRELDEPACPALFAGDNDGTDGLEGTPDDIGGSEKPWAVGKLSGITPVLLNSSTRVLGWNFDTDGSRLPSFSVDAVRYAGALWTFGADYADAAALLATTPTTGIYNTCLAESLVLMGGSATLSGRITIDVTIEETAEERWAGNLWKKTLIRAGVLDEDIDQDALDALNDAAPFEAGYFAKGDSFRDIADAMARSVAACYVPDRLGAYAIAQMAAPAGAPVAYFERFELGTAATEDMGDLKTLSPLNGSAWTPVKQVRVAFSRNWTPMSADEVAEAVTDDVRAVLTEEWRFTDPAISASAAAQYGNAESRDFETFLANREDAEEIADVLLAVFSTQRREYSAAVSYTPALAALLELGATVHITHPKFGLSAGRLAKLHGIRLKDTRQEAELKLWF